MKPQLDLPQIDDFEDFFEHTLTGFLVTTPNGRIIRANSRIADWLQIAPDDLQGKRFSDFLTISGKIYFGTHLSPLLRMQGYFDEVALDLSSADSERIPVTASALERRDKADKPLFVRLSIFRSRERRQYERDLLAARNELRELNQALAAKVAEEVAERMNTEERLHAEKEIAQLREQFVAVLGHDLRNPLAAVSAGLSVLQAMPPTDRILETVKLMEQSVARMTTLISDVLDFARARMGDGIATNRRLVQLEPFLRHAVDELKTTWPNKTINSTIALGEKVYADPERITQLLSNLLANAVSHGSRDGDVNVEVSIVADHLQLDVVNQGDPIPAATLKRMFQPFYREVSGAKRHGLGLGLYIAFQIARAHDGELTVQSSTAETRFTLQMPVQARHQA